MAESQGRKRAKALLDKKLNPGKAKKSARKALARGPTELGYSAEAVNETLFPMGQKVTLSNGDIVEVKPWSIRLFGEMAQRIPNTIAAALPDDDDATLSNADVSALFVSLTDEVVAMVAQTIGLTEEEVHEKMLFDDLLRVATVVWDVCIQGPMLKIGGLMGRVMGTPVAMSASLKMPSKTPTQPPSSSQSNT